MKPWEWFPAAGGKEKVGGQGIFSSIKDAEAP